MSGVIRKRTRQVMPCCVGPLSCRTNRLTLSGCGWVWLCIFLTYCIVLPHICYFGFRILLHSMSRLRKCARSWKSPGQIWWDPVRLSLWCSTSSIACVCIPQQVTKRRRMYLWQIVSGLSEVITLSIMLSILLTFRSRIDRLVIRWPFWLER